MIILSYLLRIKFFGKIVKFAKDVKYFALPLGPVGRTPDADWTASLNPRNWPLESELNLMNIKADLLQYEPVLRLQNFPSTGDSSL